MQSSTSDRSRIPEKLQASIITGSEGYGCLYQLFRLPKHTHNPSVSKKPEHIARILSKNDNTKQSIVTLSSSSSDLEPPLPPSAIRVKTTLIALTANNLGYAALGTRLHWWDAFPVPTSAPPPFNDSSAYGIVPAWGYATVLESTISIAPGSLLWGFWPVSTHPVILRLKATSPENHWLECSDHRKNIISFYQRYSVGFPPPSPFDEPSSNPGTASQNRSSQTPLGSSLPTQPRRRNYPAARVGTGSFG